MHGKICVCRFFFSFPAKFIGFGLTGTATFPGNRWWWEIPSSAKPITFPWRWICSLIYVIPIWKEPSVEAGNDYEQVLCYVTGAEADFDNRTSSWTFLIRYNWKITHKSSPISSELALSLFSRYLLQRYLGFQTWYQLAAHLIQVRHSSSVIGGRQLKRD